MPTLLLSVYLDQFLAQPTPTIHRSSFHYLRFTLLINVRETIDKSITNKNIKQSVIISKLLSLYIAYNETMILGSLRLHEKKSAKEVFLTFEVVVHLFVYNHLLNGITDNCV